jgi:hypothetical protein
MVKSQEKLNEFLTYVLKDKLLYYNGQLCIYEDTNYKLIFFHDCHNIAIIDQLGF